MCTTKIDSLTFLIPIDYVKKMFSLFSPQLSPLLSDSYLYVVYHINEHQKANL